MRTKIFNIVMSLTIVLVIFIFILNPSKYMTSISLGLDIWAKSVVPSLFPFFFLSKLLIELNYVTRLSYYLSPITSKLFKAKELSGYIFFISIISGYPVGAKMISDFYEKGALTKTDCIKICTFTSTSGPLFILGTVGGRFLASSTSGFIILACHILSAILTGILFREFFVDDTKTIKTVSLPLSTNALNDTIYSSVLSILFVGGFISIFYMLTDMLFSNNFLSNINGGIASFLNGIIEVTRGCKDVSAAFSPQVATVLCCGLISFGGLCIFAQSFTYLSKCGIKPQQILLFKLIQMAFALILSSIVVFGFQIF